MKLPKKFKPLVIALAALILVGAAYAMIVLLVPEEVEEEDEGIDTSKYITLVDYEVKGVDHILFEFADGYSYTMKLTHKSDTQRDYSIEGKEGYDFNSTSMSTACLTLAGISSSRLIEEDCTDLAKFGLDEPRSWVTIYGTDGTSKKITLGMDSGVGGYSYITVDDDDDVYLISSYTTKYMLNKDYAYRNTSVLTLDEDDPSTDLRSLVITNHDETVFDYIMLTEEERDALDPDLDTLQYMSVPLERGVNSTLLNDDLLTPLASISFEEVILDKPSDADFEEYGLREDTLTLSFTMEDGTSTNITLSQETEDGIRYGVVGGINSIVAFDASTFEFLEDFDYTTLVYRLIWIYYITELSGFEVTAHGVTHTVTLFDPTSDESDAGMVFEATFDGGYIKEENCRRLYQRVLSPSVYDLTDEEMEAAAEEEAEWSAVIHFDTGRADETISFHRINARQYAAYRNGEPTGYYVNVLDLEAIDEALEIISKGDTIHM